MLLCCLIWFSGFLALARIETLILHFRHLLQKCYPQLQLLVVAPVLEHVHMLHDGEHVETHLHVFVAGSNVDAVTNG